MGGPQEPWRSEQGEYGGPRLPPYEPSGLPEAPPYRIAGRRQPMLAVAAVVLAVPPLLVWRIWAGWDWVVLVCMLAGLAGVLIAVAGHRRGEQWAGTAITLVAAVTATRLVDVMEQYM